MQVRSLLALLMSAAILLGATERENETDGPPSTPGARWGHALAWDPVREELLLFGGARERGAYLGDTWTWDGEAWTVHEAPGPAPRGFAGVAYDPGRRAIVLHGGRAEGRRPHHDTWAWDGGSWRHLTDGGPAIDHFGLVYHAEAGGLLAFGGWDGQGVTDATWLFDGDWSAVPGEAPPPRSAFGMTYDAGRGVAVLSGGLWINGQYADVWEWNRSGWKAASGPYDNSSHDHHSLAWDPARKQIVGFGGKNYRYQMLDRTFTIVDGELRSLGEAGPVARHSTPLAWDGRSERIVLYGGKVYEDREQIPLDDFWAWDGAAWQRLEPQSLSQTR